MRSNTVRMCWIAVIALVLSGVLCLLGPGQVLPKYFEGRVIFVVVDGHGLAELDLAGISLIGGAIYVGWKLHGRAGSHADRQTGGAE